MKYKVLCVSMAAVMLLSAACSQSSSSSQSADSSQAAASSGSQQEASAAPEEKKDIKYKVKNGVLVPYLELKFDKAAIEEITVGPLIEQDLAVKNLREFLEQRGYSDVDIKVSEIPIRY